MLLVDDPEASGAPGRALQGLREGADQVDGGGMPAKRLPAKRCQQRCGRFRKRRQGKVMSGFDHGHQARLPGVTVRAAQETQFGQIHRVLALAQAAA
jgi:hypothetical protein